MVIIDTLRSDTFFNNIKGMSNFSKYVDDFSIDNDVISPSPWTLPSHFSIFTGKYVSEHGMERIKGEVTYYQLLSRVKKSNLKLLTEELKERGYTTLGYSANPFVSPLTGIDRGFDSFVAIEQRHLPEKLQSKLNKLKDKGNTLNDILRSLLYSGDLRNLAELPFLYYKFQREQKKSGFPRDKGGLYMVDLLTHTSLRKPFFVFFNFMEMHEPYLKTETLNNPFGGFQDLLGISRISDSTLAKMKAIYDSQVFVVDRLLGKLLDYLKSINAYDDTLIILTSDHGQAFKENNYYGHGLFLYDEIIKVPLLIKYPLNYSGEIKNLLSLSDIYRLILGCADGLRVQLVGGSTRPIFSESYGTFIDKKDFTHHTDALKRLYEINVNRKAILRDGYKLTINSTTGDVEEFSFKGRRIRLEGYEAIYQSLVKELELFKEAEEFSVKKEAKREEFKEQL